MLASTLQAEELGLRFPEFFGRFVSWVRRSRAAKERRKMGHGCGLE